MCGMVSQVRRVKQSAWFCGKIVRPCAMDRSGNLVEFRSVSFSAGENRIIHDLTFDVRRGEVLVLLGESGCGKTTTLKLINRLIEPTSGEVIVDDRSTTSWDAIDLRRRIGYVLQDGGLFP